MLLNTYYRLCKGYEQYRKMSNKEDVDTEPKAEIESDTKLEDNVVVVPEDTEKVEGDDGNLYINILQQLFLVDRARNFIRYPGTGFMCY